MAIFSMSVQTIGRSSGRSIVAAAAYRAGERLRDERLGVTHDYTRKGGVVHKELILPDNAPAWARKLSRESLWNMVDARERRKDAQTAREIRVMLPRELSSNERIDVVRDFVARNFVSKGMIADVAWHNPISKNDGLEQPHAHILLTQRPLVAEGLGNKSKHDMVPDPSGRTHPNGRPVLVESNPESWNSAQFYGRCREDWEHTANAALERAGSSERIDRRSYLERGIDRRAEPALRLAMHLRELRGVMKDRWGQFQYVRFYRAVEDRAIEAFNRTENLPAAEAAQRMAHYHQWFDRQIERLAPSPVELAPALPRSLPDLER